MKRLLLIMACLPLKQLHLNSGFGYRVHPVSGKVRLHEGIDLRARSDTVYAVLDGEVSAIAWGRSIGLYVRLSHGAVSTLYGHLSRVLVMPGDSVSAGRPIAVTGRTGIVTGEHLHFAVWNGKRFVDPVRFLYRLLCGKNLYTPNQ